MNKLTEKRMIPDIVDGILKYLRYRDRKNLSLASPELLRFCKQSASFRDQDSELESIIGKVTLWFTEEAFSANIIWLFHRQVT